MLDPQYFLKLLSYVGETTRDRTAKDRKNFASQRREFYKKEQWTEYEEIVKNALNNEDQAAQAVLKQVLEALNISE